MPIRRDCHLVIVIPAYRETNLQRVLLSLADCKAPNQPVHAMILYNASTDEKEAVEDCILSLNEYHLPPWLTVDQATQLFPPKRAGVGLARKTMMDSVISLTEGRETSTLIVNLDADCVVHSDYLVKIAHYSKQRPEFEAWSIDFEHQEEDAEIMAYELHLRYHRLLAKACGYWHAYHTIGSAMAVWDYAYCKQGGMPPRKAGEDFYFLHKFAKLGTLGVIPHPLIFPSGRPSDRVPFGTGRAVLQNQKSGTQLTYSPVVISVVREYLDYLLSRGAFEAPGNGEILSDINQSWHLSTRGKEWLANVRLHTRDLNSYRKRVEAYFDAFKMMKYLHYLRDHGFEDVPVMDATWDFAKQMQWRQTDTLAERLLLFREKDRLSLAEESAEDSMQSGPNL